MNGAIEVFIKYLAKELGPKDIGANVVAPGPVDTDFNNAAIRNNPQMKAALSSISPLGRVGVVDDIGSVVAFLCAGEALMINGQRIEVSGGINVYATPLVTTYAPGKPGYNSIIMFIGNCQPYNV